MRCLYNRLDSEAVEAVGWTKLYLVGSKSGLKSQESTVAKNRALQLRCRSMSVVVGHLGHWTLSDRIAVVSDVAASVAVVVALDVTASVAVALADTGVAGTTASVAVFETGLFPLLRTSFKSSVRRAFVAFDSAFVALDSSWDALKAASNVAMRAAVGSVS
jgi:hypothetical protein